MEYDINKIFISNYIIYNKKLQKYIEYNYYLKYIMVESVRVNDEYYYIKFGDNKIIKQINPNDVKNGKINKVDPNYDKFSGHLCFGKVIPIYSYTTDEERKTGLITCERIENICCEVNKLNPVESKQKSKKILKFRPIK